MLFCSFLSCEKKNSSILVYIIFLNYNSVDQEKGKKKDYTIKDISI